MYNAEKNELTFFKNEKNEWQKEWVDMPEYSNILEKEAEITALFKFRNKDDFEEFNNLLKKYVYKTNKIFDGMQRKNKKSAWFPLKEKSSKYEYR